ncbi:hypothetical protein L218DRAFT_952893 [Marasmius fiardii PR-910]|nr:hypothetical protein L218DRAFT_952893 [Marasmius fiardii PR-910]
MNRHHPYGGGGYDSHRGGSFSSGPGPDRHHRGGGRGRGNFGRGRGGGGGGNGGGYGQSGGGGYDGNMSYGAYDQHQDDMNGYNSNHDSSNSYYQNYGGASSQYGYNQGYGKQEDDSGFEEDSLGRMRRPVRKDRDDNLIEQRIQRERPCRTLFIRNIKYETNSSDVRRLFEEHGDIKTFFDLISTRGMVFVTYYDLRAAERARERLQGSEISGRPIDVHYSLPRDDRGDDKNNQLQGCLQVTLRNSPSGMIDDNEVRRKFQQFGDVKSVQPVGDRIDSRYVEFYDTRACDDAYDRLRHQGLQDGVMDIAFAWDVNDGGAQGSHRPKDSYDEGGRRGGGSGNRGGGYDDDYDRRDNFGRDRGGGRGGRGGGGGGGGRFDDDWSGRKDSYNDRYDGPRFVANSNNYGSNVTGPSFNPPPPAALQPQAADDRLEQAKKVQQLLAALKQPAPNASSAPPGSGSVPPMPGVPQLTQPGAPPMANPYYPPPGSGGLQAPYPGAVPPPNMYGPPQPPPPGQSSSTPAGIVPPPPVVSPPPAALSALPPNVLALLQSAQHQQQQPGGAPPPGMPPYSMPPPMMGTPSPGAPVPGNPSYQHLMSMMQQPKRP